MIQRMIILYLLCAICQMARAQSHLDTEKLDNYFNELSENEKFMGSVAVSKKGKLIYATSIGYVDVQQQMKARENSKYRIGSISKTFTAILVLKAVEKKKISLDQSIDKWFPKIPNAAKITVEQLLFHRSGIHNITDDPNYLRWNTEPKTAEEMVEMIAKSGSDFEPNSTTAYSNSNFVLLSYILEKTCSTTYADLVAREIVKPLGLKNTYVFGKIDVSNNECKSYSYANGWKEEAETNHTIPMGAGAIASTPLDLIAFSDALFSGQLLKRKSLKIMKNVRDGLGAGLFHIPFFERSGFGHTGGIDGFRSVVVHFEEEDVSYALTSNGTRIDPNDISMAVLSAVFDRPYEIPSVSTFEVSPEDLDKYVGVYSSEQLEMNITVTKEGNMLIAQGTDQPAFGLEPVGKDEFTFDSAGVKMVFVPTENVMTLFQGGLKITFKKE